MTWDWNPEKDTVKFEAALSFSRALRLRNNDDNWRLYYEANIWLHTWQDKHWNILSRSFQQKFWLFEKQKAYICSTTWWKLSRIYYSKLDTNSRLTIRDRRICQQGEGDQYHHSIDASPNLSLGSVYGDKKSTDLRDKQSGVNRIDHENIHERIRSRHPVH